MVSGAVAAAPDGVRAVVGASEEAEMGADGLLVFGGACCASAEKAKTSVSKVVAAGVRAPRRRGGQQDSAPGLNFNGLRLCMHRSPRRRLCLISCDALLLGCVARSSGPRATP